MKSIAKHTHVKLIYVLLCALLLPLSLPAQQNTPQQQQQQQQPKVMVLKIGSEIDPRTNRYTRLALEEATRLEVDHILLELDTYGGAVNDADEIRKRLMEYPKPVYVFINKNAASAGALISIACDSIYMAPGANIGAATVVGADGVAASGKYQSYMRSIMRSTAESQGRDPHLAEAMVEASVDSTLSAGQVLTFTTSEAIKHGFCEGRASSITEVLQHLNLQEAELIPYSLSTTDKVIDFFINPFVSGILLLIILGGLYFELQTPGVGFPLMAALVAGVFYLTPYYLNGLAEHWEILLFVIGLVLIGLEVLVIPGFGITGISGIILVFLSLVLIMVNNQNFDFTFVAPEALMSSLVAVLVGMIGAVILVVLTWDRVVGSNSMKRLILHQTMDSGKGYRSSVAASHLIGKTGIAHTRMTPSGRVMIDDTLYDAHARDGFIDRGEAVEVLEHTTFSLKVKKISS